jgi:spermidine synthase
MTDPDGSQTNFTRRFCILHDSDTDMGRLMLRRRWSLALERDVYEMTMDGKLMMSSAVVESECALAERALALLPDKPLHVLIGGLGFGQTVQSTLADRRVCGVTVIERLAEVIDWHRSSVFPWSADFVHDARLQVRHDDFFAVVTGEPATEYDAILIDIDDSPELLWHGSHASFYRSRSLEAVRRHLTPEGMLALWCAASPSQEFIEAAETVFAATTLIEIDFENPCLRQPETNYILLATAHLSPEQERIERA